MIRICVLFSLLLMGAGCEPDITNNPPSGKNIIAFGDSLTAGVGAEEGKTYPDHLSELLGEPVLNRGVSGDTTGEALSRLEKDVLSEHPRIVIVWLGANDELRQLPGDESIHNLSTIVGSIQSKGGLVALVGVPEIPFRPSLNEKIIGLAKEKGCVYVPNPLHGMLTDPELKSDQIHPNSKGYRLVAERIAKKIKKYAARP